MSPLAAVRRRLDLKSEKGVSLVEMLVTMLISGILLAIVGNMFVNIARITTNSNATTVRSSTAANLVEELSEVIRQAAPNAVATSDDADPAVVVATATTLTIYSYTDANPAAPAPVKVSFRVDAAGNLIEDRTAAVISASYWVFTGTTTSRTLPGPIAPAGLFTYLDASGAVIPISGTGLTLVQRGAVASIRLTLTLPNSTTVGTGSDPIVILNTVGMPNLKIARTDDD